MSGGKKMEWWIVEEFGVASNWQSNPLSRARMGNGKVLIRNGEAFFWGNKWHPHLQLAERIHRDNEMAGGCLSTFMNSICSCFCRHLLAKTHNSLVPLVPRVGRTAEGMWQGMQASNRWETEEPITPCCNNRWVSDIRGGDEVIHSDKRYLSHICLLLERHICHPSIPASMWGKMYVHECNT